MRILILGTDRTILDENSKLSERMREYQKLVERITIIVPESKNKIIGLIGIFFQSKRLLKKEKYDVISVQDPYYLGLLGWILAKKFKIGLHIQVHGWEKFCGLRKLTAKFVLSRADAVRTVSQRLKRQLIEEFKVKKEKITVAPIYVEISNLKSQISKIKKNNKFVFLNVGRLVPVKNIKIQIETMKDIVKKYPSAELWIVGDGEEKSNLKSQISNLNLENNVRMFGWQGEVGKFYEQADAFLLTSDYEGWGMVVIEAAIYGLPIIMTDVGCAGEIIKNGENGIVIPVGNKNKLTEVMLKLIADTDLRKKMGQNAQVAVKKLPNKEKTLRLYKESWGRAVIK